MASLEIIEYSPHRHIVTTDGKVIWEKDTACESITHLPQIFWEDGTPWSEANLWALERSTSGKTDIKTVLSNMSHLHKYAKWLSSEGLDWRHFPMLERDRVLIRWRKKLIELRDKLGLLAPSTATQRMNATIGFYKYASANGFIGNKSLLWNDRKVVRTFFDQKGFERTFLVTSTDLAIPNRARHGLQLEGGITPITKEQMYELLSFAKSSSRISIELNLILKIGFYSGARIETITDLKRESLEKAVSDPRVPGLIFIAVGPGSVPHVATKFNIHGRIGIPKWLFNELSDYITTVRRLRREALAINKDKELVFITRFGHKYAGREGGSGTAIDRAMVDLRREATGSNLTFMKNFHFHMTRATFGTWLTATLLEKGYHHKAVLSFVRDAMLHKDIETTLKYIKFVEQTSMKIAVANEFSEAFLGLNTSIGFKDD